MKFIIISEANLASKNMGKFLANLPKDVKIIKTQKSVLELESDLIKLKDAELVIVASTHKSKAKVPMLNCHPPGNWGSADLGGKEKTLSIAPALYLRQGVLEYQKLKSENSKLQKYEVGMEATHHGPTLDLPIMFVEVGSTEKEWNDKEACKAAAQVIMKLVSVRPEKTEVAVGFGGGHYCPSFNKRLNEIAFGHICPKYRAENLDETTILRAFNKTVPKPNKALLDWKGLNSEQKKNITSVLDKHKIKWEKV